ncbi:MAG: glycosyltransferase [Bacteroidales bacterium]|nr:glycosyltransferase [Bacteroidales bacterium]
MTDNILVFIIFIIFSFSALIQLIYYWRVFGSFAFYKKKQIYNSYQGVSVVISARNEYFNLKKNLPKILEQDYSDFEVVVVNDSSTDDSNVLLKEFSAKYDNLKVVNLKENLNFFSGKKFPLSLGIKSAKNEFIILTDADCWPRSPKWISSIEANFSNDKKIVLAYGGYEKRKGLLNKIIRFDTIQIAIHYFSFALIGKPYMGVGRNLAYRKSLFYKSKGFISHYKINSGDDDLFINSVANKQNTSVEFQPESHTISVPETSFSRWIKQKRRHLLTGKYYKAKFKILLGGFSLSQGIFYLTLILLLANLYNIIIVLSVYLVRLLSQLIIMKKCFNQLEEKGLIWLSPIFELFFMLLIPFCSLTNIFIKQKKWK